MNLNRIGLISYLSLSVPVLANEDPVIVTADELLFDEEQRAKASEILTQKQIMERTARTFPEALNAVKGIHVQKTTHGHGSPFIRGFTGRQNLLLLDGVRLNNSTWRSGPVQYWNTVDPYYLSDIVISKGVGSVLYGSDSFGGTVNALTPETGFLQEEGLYNNGRLIYRYESNSDSHLGRVESQVGFGEKWGLHLGLTYKDYGDIDDPAIGVLENTGYKELNFDAKFEWAINDDLQLTILHQQINQDDVWRWHNTIFNRGWEHDGHIFAAGSNQFRIYDQERSLTYAKLEGIDDEGVIESWRTTFSYQTSQDSETRQRGVNDPVTLGVIDLETYGLDMQAKSTVFGGSLLYGANLYYDVVDSLGVNTDRPVADDATYFNRGLYAQYSKEFNDHFTLVTGGRYSRINAEWERYRAQGESVDSSGDADFDDFSGSLRGIYNITDEFQILGGISQGFRAPNLDDLTGDQLVLSGLNSSGSPDLEPEEFLSYELGANYRTDRLNVEVAAFYTRLDDAIVRVDQASGTNDLVTTNGGEGETWGAEASLSYRFADQWTTGGQIFFVRGRVERPEFSGGPTQRDNFNQLPPLQGELFLRWDSLEGKYWVEGRVELTAEADILSQRETRGDDDQRIAVNGTPSYVLGSLRGGMLLSENLNLTVGLENLGNIDYRVHGSGVNGGGFNAVFNLEYSW